MPDLPSLILLLHAFATLFMTGLIWFVQIVHYPLFALVGRDVYPRYQETHMQRTGWVVGPAMLTEAVTAAALLTLDLQSPGRILAIAGIVLVALIWISTAALQIPRHHALRRAFDERAARSLVTTNWIRTALWTARALIALALLQLGAAS
ncbi:MAG: hypothetical protein VYC34_09735 [Planctomycetota bacterium]|nr:hypothetical protein [Planctomycetota bacterium]